MKILAILVLSLFTALAYSQSRAVTLQDVLDLIAEQDAAKEKLICSQELQKYSLTIRWDEQSRFETSNVFLPINRISKTLLCGYLEDSGGVMRYIQNRISEESLRIDLNYGDSDSNIILYFDTDLEGRVYKEMFSGSGFYGTFFLAEE